MLDPRRPAVCLDARIWGVGRLLALMIATLTIPLTGAAVAQDRTLPVRLRPGARFVVGHGTISALDVHVGRQRMATGGSQGDLVLQTYPGGKILWKRRASDHWFQTVRFSPGGRFLAASARTLTVWSLAGERIRELPTGGNPVGVAWNPEGTLLAFGGAGVTIVGTGSWQVKRRFTGMAKWFERLVFSRDGKRLFAGTGDGSTWALDLESGRADKIAERRGENGGDGASVVHIQRLGAELLCGYGDGVVRWGATRIRHGRYLLAAAAHGDRIVTAASDHRVRCFDRSGKQTGELRVDAGAMRFAPGGEAVLLATADGRLLRWDFTKTEVLRNAHMSCVVYLAFSRDGRYLGAAAAGPGKPIVRCEVLTGVTRDYREGKPLGPGPERGEILTRDRSGLAVRDARTWTVVRRIPKTPSYVDLTDALALAPDKRTLLLADHFFDITTGESTTVDHSVSNVEVTWSSKGHAAVRYGIGIDSGSGIRVFDPARRLVFEREYNAPGGCPFSGVLAHDMAPSGRVLIYVEWQRNGANLLHRIDMKHTDRQFANEIDAPVVWWRFLDEKLALASTPTGMELWDASNLRGLGVLDAELRGVRTLVLSPDRRWLAAAFPLEVRLYAIERRR